MHGSVTGNALVPVSEGGSGGGGCNAGLGMLALLAVALGILAFKFREA